MGVIERNGFTLNSEQEDGSQTLSIRLSHQPLIIPIVFRVRVLNLAAQHEVVIQREPVNRLAGRQADLGISSHEGLGRLLTPASDYVHATGFTSLRDDLNTYELNLYRSGYFRSQNPEAVIRVGGNRDYMEDDGTSLTDSVFDEKEMRVFAVTNNDVRGSNRIKIPRDLRPYVGPNAKDLIEVVEFSPML